MRSLAKFAAIEEYSAPKDLFVSIITELTRQIPLAPTIAGLGLASGGRDFPMASMKAFRALMSLSRVASALFSTLSIVFVALFSEMLPAQELSQGMRLVLQSPESLPEPRDETADAVRLPDDCERVPPDPPLSALNADIRPRNHDGQFISSEDLPTNCARYALGEPTARVLCLPSGACQPSTCELLQMARFCHHPLYFNDECLERYGVRSCCIQPAASAARFYGGVLLMPIRVMYRCPYTCVSTPPCNYCD